MILHLFLGERAGGTTEALNALSMASLTLGVELLVVEEILHHLVYPIPCNSTLRVFPQP